MIVQDKAITRTHLLQPEVTVLHGSLVVKDLKMYYVTEDFTLTVSGVKLETLCTSQALTTAVNGITS